MTSRPIYYYIRGDFKAKFHGTLDDQEGLRGTAFYEIDFFDTELTNPKKELQFSKLNYKELEPDENKRIIQKQLKNVLINMDGKFYEESFEDVLLQDIKIRKTATEGKETFGEISCKITAIAYTSVLFYTHKRFNDPWDENMFRELQLEEVFEPTPIVVELPELKTTPTPASEEPSLWNFILLTFSLLFFLWLLSLILSWFEALDRESMVSFLILAGIFSMALLIQWILPKIQSRFSAQPVRLDGWFFARFLLLLASGGLTYYLLYSHLNQLAGISAVVTLFVLGSFIFRKAYWFYNRFFYTVVVLYLTVLFVGMGFRDRIFPEKMQQQSLSKDSPGITYKSTLPFHFFNTTDQPLPFPEFLIEQTFFEARSKQLYKNSHAGYFEFQKSFWSELYRMKEESNFTREAFAQFIVQSCRQVSASEEFWEKVGLLDGEIANEQAAAAWLYQSLAHFDYDVILLKNKAYGRYLIGINYYFEEGGISIQHQGSRYYLLAPDNPLLKIGDLEEADFDPEKYRVVRVK